MIQGFPEAPMSFTEIKTLRYTYPMNRKAVTQGSKFREGALSLSEGFTFTVLRELNSHRAFSPSGVLSVVQDRNVMLPSGDPVASKP